MAPLVQVVPVHLTPASRMCEQLLSPIVREQSMSLDSVPTQWTLLNHIRPTPLVKPDLRAVAAVIKNAKCSMKLPAAVEASSKKCNSKLIGLKCSAKIVLHALMHVRGRAIYEQKEAIVSGSGLSG